MGKLKSLLAGALLGAGGMYVGLQYHVLQAEEGFLLVPRTPQQRMQDAYADVRDWDAATWAARPHVSLAVTDYGRSDLITDGVTSNVLGNLRESIAPLPQNLQSKTNQSTTNRWEPSNTTSTPTPRQPVSPTESSPAKPSPAQRPPARRGFLPLADLFGIGGDRPTTAEPVPPPPAAVTPVLPAGVSQRKKVEILPSPAEAEILIGPTDVNLGPTAPLPGHRQRNDRRRSEASGTWQPLTVHPF